MENKTDSKEPVQLSFIDWCLEGVRGGFIKATCTVEWMIAMYPVKVG